MLEPNEIKDALQRNGLIQNDLFELGTYKRSTLLTAPLTALSVSAISYFDFSTTSSLFAFTLVDGKLIITPIKKNTVMIEDSASVAKDDVKEVKFKTSALGDGILEIIHNNGKKKEYCIGFLKAPFENIRNIVERFNSYISSDNLSVGDPEGK